MLSLPLVAGSARSHVVDHSQRKSMLGCFSKSLVELHSMFLVLFCQLKRAKGTLWWHKKHNNIMEGIRIQDNRQ